MDNKIDNNDLNELLSILSISEYKIIGSKGDPNINDEVISDIDSQDVELNSKLNYEDILKHFQNVFKILKKSKTVIITDFKCGYNSQMDKPYRWNYKTIMKGFQYDEENNKVYFIDELKKYSIIKIDTIIYNNNEYIELTMNYYFKFTHKKKTRQEILKDLKEDIKEYKNNGNYYKALKRLHSYNKILGKKDTKLINIINSNYGILAKEKSRLETLLYLMKYHSGFFNLDKQKKRYSIKTKNDIIERINEIDKVINTNELLKFLK